MTGDMLGGSKGITGILSRMGQGHIGSLGAVVTLLHLPVAYNLFPERELKRYIFIRVDRSITADNTLCVINGCYSHKNDTGFPIGLNTRYPMMNEHMLIVAR
ncbi:hypothetical protein [Methanolobus profundi]|uniref:Uncharacterized protein n=1 Tax=Methanolobus profundi TaxID=487685 RepID=A0A1I4R0Q4_9EURY|nr:hypothetical protein [Methanolobus profundi]SFM45530.1 hypothetical protein SAMN04488696_1286 [Methanolobus profundi]